MRHIMTFVGTLIVSAVGLYMFIADRVEVEPEQVADYQAGSAFLGFIVAALVTAALK